MLTTSAVEESDGHLLWQGGLANGRPAGKFGGRVRYVRRVVWERLHGPIPAGMTVRTTCGRQRCVSPEHLRLEPPGRHQAPRRNGRFGPDKPIEEAA